MNRTFSLEGKTGRSDIYIGRWDQLHDKLLPNSNIVYLTDENIHRIYHPFFMDKNTIVIQAGEKSKSLSNIKTVFSKMLDIGMDRQSFLIGIGGGVVTDITGFVASTYMRGIEFAFISTTLLGQVDAVIGGKNGVNLFGYKNIIGTFNQPSFIINDPAFFETLPEKEYISGSAEVIKQFAICDKNLTTWFFDNSSRFKLKDIDFLYELIEKQNSIKVQIVQEDERESGKRKLLNFGHTFGHAIEKHKQWPHGFAVAAGMVAAVRISHSLGLLANFELEQFIDSIKLCDLPVFSGISGEDAMIHIRKDKKRNGESIDFILLETIGKAKVNPIKFDELNKLIQKIEL